MTLDINTLNAVGDELFEKIVKALLMHIIGPGVTPFSKGQDGAREATFEGKAAYPSEIDAWSGHWIFQVKHSDLGLGVDKARDSVKYLINGELVKLKKYGYLSNGGCDNYIYITNVPFTGLAKTGMHDYIADKKKEYGISNFHHWDGEKVLTFLNSYPPVRETFFPATGFSEIETQVLKKNKQLFVEPVQYGRLKQTLLNDRILNIVGPPHVGKTSLALYLGDEILKSEKLNKLWLVDFIENIPDVPKTENCVIIFDDLYGDITYEEIGRKTKILNRLSQNNYIIVTSRDYIFRSAELKAETIEGNARTELILQEGSYTNGMLMEILKKHATLKLNTGGFPASTFNLILAHKGRIIESLRFPHNIQVFIELCDKNTRYSRDIENVIAAAKHIEKAIKTYIKTLPEYAKRPLMLAALGKFQDLDMIFDSASLCWGYERSKIIDELERCPSIISLSGDHFRFVHPSYKSAITGYFNDQHHNLLSETILKLTFELPSKAFRIYQNHINDAIAGLSSERIMGLLNLTWLEPKMLVNIWMILIRRDYAEAFRILKLVKQSSQRKDAGSVFTTTFLKSKDKLSTREVQGLIDYLLNLRATTPYDRLLDLLIAELCYKNKSKASVVLRKLQINSVPDLKLRVNILAALGNLHPERVYDELCILSKHENLGVRTAVYKAFLILSGKFRKIATNDLLIFEEAETNERAKEWLRGVNLNRQKKRI